MSKYVICCPNCGNSNLEEPDYNCFECECGEEFDIERAEVKEL